MRGGTAREAGRAGNLAAADSCAQANRTLISDAVSVFLQAGDAVGYCASRQLGGVLS